MVLGSGDPKRCKKMMSEDRYTVTKRNLVWVDVDEVKAETASAILVSDGDREEWIPKSQIGKLSEVQGKGDKGRLLIPEWLAQDRGFI